MDMPRIKAVSPKAGTMLDIEWQNGTRSSVNLIGWIATGGDLLAPLKSEEVWKTATVEDFGATIEWARDDLGSEDLAIDAYHLSQIAEDQRSYTGDDLAKWQKELGLSNNEAADLLGCLCAHGKTTRRGKTSVMQSRSFSVQAAVIR